MPWGLALVYRAAGRWTALWFGLLLLQGLLPVATVYLTREIVDALAAGMGRGVSWDQLHPLLFWTVVLAGVLLLGEVLQSFGAWVRAHQAERLLAYLAELVHTHSSQLDLACFETPDYFDRLHRARSGARQRPLALLEQTGSSLQSIVSLLALLSILIPLGPWLPLVLLSGTLPALVVVLRAAVREYEWRVRTTAQQRRSRYLDFLLGSAEAAAELRLFDLGRYFADDFQKILRQLRDGRLQLLRRETLGRLSAVVFALLVTGATMGWMVLRVLYGRASLGDLAFFYQAFNQGQKLLRAALQQAGQIFGHVLFIGDLKQFLELKPTIERPPQPQDALAASSSSSGNVSTNGVGQGAGSSIGLIRPAPGIRFERVRFAYPSRAKPVLDDFDLEIPAGKTTAIVGDNGAGKSTLIKLICRLYDPQAGQVTLDGTDLRSLAVGSLRRGISVLFQVPVHYAATVAQNIAFGDLAAEPGRDRIVRAAAAAGADEALAHLPHGLDTMLGTRFVGGHELSAGEWQRVCLARAILRDAPLVLLDEPTSAMDTWAERHWMDRLRSATAGKTVILITHRFSTAQRADLILVMQAGRIVESGSHEQLVFRGGHYAAGIDRPV